MAEISAAATDHRVEGLAAKRDYVAAYVGLSWPDFAGAYDRLGQSRLVFSWSWTVFFFPWIWLIYRTVWPLGFCVWALELTAVGFMGRWAFLTVLPIRIFFGAFGRSIFLRHALRKVSRAIESSSSEREVLAQVKAAGIAKGAALFLVVIPMLVLFLILHPYRY